MSDRERRLIFGLVVLHAAIPLALMIQHLHTTPEYATGSDAALYRALALHRGRPYIDFQSAYPPLAFVFFKVIGPDSFRGFLLRLIAAQAVADFAIASCVWKAWGRRAGVIYLALSAPLLAHVETKFDLVSVALAVGGAALVVRHREGPGGALMAVSAFVKLWPAALIPAFYARRQWRAAVAATVVVVAGLLAWVAYGRVDGVRQVVTYRGAEGWHIDSVPGSLLYAFTRDLPRFEQGTWRVGAPPGFWAALITAATIATIGWAWWRASRLEHEVDGVAETTVVAALLVLATLCSVQFVAWLIPWAAIAAARGEHRIHVATWVVVLATLVGQLMYQAGRARPPVVAEVAVGVRNLALIAVLVAGCAALARRKALVR